MQARLKQMTHYRIETRMTLSLETVHCLPWRKLEAVRWKNGGGTTREVACDASASEPGWRLSIADLDRAGPFSSFSGWQRCFGVLGRHPVTLAFGDREVGLSLAESAVFSGGEPVDCRLPEGPSLALNLMFDPARWDGSMKPCQWDDVVCPKGCEAAWFVLAACPTQPSQGGCTWMAGDTLVLKSHPARRNERCFDVPAPTVLADTSVAGFLIAIYPAQLSSKERK